MKRIIVLIAVIMFAVVPFAQAGEYQLTFAWEQAEVDLPHLAKWKLYMSGAGIGTQSVDIVYTDGAGPTFTSDQVLNVEVLPGQSVIRNFTLTAVGKNGRESAASNQVDHTFTVAFNDVSTPQTLRITGVVVVP
jgi:hypothetical protein